MSKKEQIRTLGEIAQVLDKARRKLKGSTDTILLDDLARAYLASMALSMAIFEN